MLVMATLFVAGCTEKPEQPEEEVIHLTQGEWIDLGLPSGLLWASCNVGATVPEEYGDYFAWGETEPKREYTLSNYKWCVYYPDSGGISWTKYCNDSILGYNGYFDSLTTLEPCDDAATVNMGGGARTPTVAEWQELVDNATFKWTSINGVNGELVKGKNGNSIFLPAAGSYGEWDSSENGIGSSGSYWTGSLDEGSRAWFFLFTSDSYYGCMDQSWRYWGCTVRAVRSAR